MLICYFYAYILEGKIAIDDNFYWKTKDEEHVAGEREREMEKYRVSQKKV